MPEVPEIPVDITHTTTRLPPPIDNTPPPSPIMNGRWGMSGLGQPVTNTPPPAPMLAGLGQGADVNHGSIDAGGPVDQICAWWVQADSPAYPFMQDMEDINQRSVNSTGVPYYVPNIIGFTKTGTIFFLGATFGGLHGWRRSGGKWGPAIGYGALTAFLPLVGVGVALFQGFGKKGRR
jgi:hypothetical protein